MVSKPHFPCQKCDFRQISGIFAPPRPPLLVLSKAEASKPNGLKFPEIAEHLLVLVGTSFSFISSGFCRVSLLLNFVSTILRLEITPFSIICALAFLVYGDVDFLLPSHIAFPRFVVRLVPLHHPVNLLSFWRTRFPCSEILQILPN